ncbi:MAG: hypothetical protein DRG87_08550 [Deltaproteobacteria bacterium]|nr:hypothetical protein [Deltaproteobacteria bacterium]MBW2078398.1 hypothetical protein [Deltaproteobacteria bacterium]MBW2311543.1 hypothetical protein [Deltaproteobacteria bacterium]RLB28813.1 MAG: hypothetical protein DRG87_08550 [Deltaproteobacteria bacterium]
MGEIKSTIDLVLEKTNGLTLSSEDKEKLAQKELEKKIQGLISRYLDQFIPLSRLTEEMEKIAGAKKDLSVRLAKRHLLAHLDFDRDNSHILSALEEIADVDTAPLVALQEQYQSEIEEAKKGITEKGIEKLRKKGISGSAVVPNLGRDPAWTQFLEGLHKRYQERLEPMVL